MPRPLGGSDTSKTQLPRLDRVAGVPAGSSDMRSGHKFSVELVSPVMVRTNDASPSTNVCLEERRASMAADVVENTQFFSVSHDQECVTEYVDWKDVPLACDIGGQGDTYPGIGKYGLTFEIECSAVRKKPAR